MDGKTVGSNFLCLPSTKVTLISLERALAERSQRPWVDLRRNDRRCSGPEFKARPRREDCASVCLRPARARFVIHFINAPGSLSARRAEEETSGRTTNYQREPRRCNHGVRISAIPLLAHLNLLRPRLYS